MQPGMSTILARWSGFAAIAGGLLWITLGTLIAYAWHNPVFGLTYEDYNRLSPLPRLLVLAGISGFYVRQQGRSGKLGLTGFVMAVAGLTLITLGNVVEFWIGGGIRFGNKPLSHAGWTMVLAGMPVMYLGLILFGAATWRARALPGWRCAAPLIVIALLLLGIVSDLLVRWSGIQVSGPFLASIGVGAGWILLGYAQLQRADSEVLRARPC